MADEAINLRQLDLREVFPWLHLFRSFSLAMDVKKIALGAAGALLTAAAWWGIASLLVGEEPTPPDLTAIALEERAKAQQEYQQRRTRYDLYQQARRWPWEQGAGGAADPRLRAAVDPYQSPLTKDGWIAGGVPASFSLVLEPVRQLLFPVRMIVQGTGSALAGFLLFALALLVWAAFGGAITRIAAVQFARDGQIGWQEALRYAVSHYLSFLVAPLLPLAGMLVIVVFCALGGLATLVPGLNVFMGILWFLALIAGFVITVALLGLVLGWPLMYASISTESTESFDALSRSYSYILGRPWSFLFYCAVAAFFGGLLATLIVILAYWTVHLSQYAVSWGGGGPLLRQLYAFIPSVGGWQADFGPAANALPTGTVHFTAVLVGIWVHAVFLAIVGFVYSYFWSVATIIYFLLRRHVDEADLEEVYLEEEEEEPFPTIAPILSGVGEPPHPPAPPGLGTSLPIIEPPPPR